MTEFPFLSMLNNIPLYAYLILSLTIHVSGRLFGFRLLSVVNNAAISMRLLGSILDPDFISSNRYLELRLQGNIAVHIFNLLTKHHTSFSTGHTNLHSHWQCRRVSFLHTLLRELTFICPFDDSYFHGRRRQWHPTPVLLPGKSHGWRSLVGYSPWGH